MVTIPQISRQNTVCTSSAPRSCHSFWFDHPNNISSGIQIMGLFQYINKRCNKICAFLTIFCVLFRDSILCLITLMWYFRIIAVEWHVWRSRSLSEYSLIVLRGAGKVTWYVTFPNVGRNLFSRCVFRTGNPVALPTYNDQDHEIPYLLC